MRPGMRGLLLLSCLGAVGITAQTAGSGPTPVQSSGRMDPQKVIVTRGETLAVAAGPAEHFRGAVRMQTLFDAKGPARGHAVNVTFAPGARTAWHSHPLGQFLIVTAGSGLVQQWGGPIEEIHPGDVVWIPANQKHWHGASASSSMTHIAIAEQEGGQGTRWMEQVSDEQYRGAR